MLWGQMRWLSVTFFPSIWHSDLQGLHWVLDWKTRVLCQKWKEAGWIQAEAQQDTRGRDPGQGWNTGLASVSHIKVMPRPQGTHLCGYKSSFESFRYCLNSQVQNHRDCTTEICLLLPCNIFPCVALSASFVVKVLIMTELIILTHLVVSYSTKVFTQLSYYSVIVN